MNIDAQTEQEKMALIKENNELFLDLVNAHQTKDAADIVSEFTRMRVRESSFVERILPSQKLSNDQLDKQVYTEHPVKISEREPGTPASYTVPYGGMPEEFYFRGDRYAVHFDRIMTPKFLKDVGELRTTEMDIRQIIADNSALDMDDHLDSKFIETVLTIVSNGAANLANPNAGENVIQPITGVVQNQHIAAPISRETIFDMMKIQPKSPTRAETATVLLNNITVKEIAKFGRDEFGGDLAQEVMINGFAERTFGGARFLVTIKHELVPDNVFFLFMDPKYMGKHFTLEDTTLNLEKRAFMLEFFSYRECGMTIGNISSVARVRIEP